MVNSYRYHPAPNIHSCVAQKGVSANLLKINSKRRKKKTEMLEQQVQQSYRDQINEEVARQTKTLKSQLIEKEAEAQSNQNVASILSEFIRQGDAAIDDMGQVTPKPQIKMWKFVF